MDNPNRDHAIESRASSFLLWINPVMVKPSSLVTFHMLCVISAHSIDHEEKDQEEEQDDGNRANEY